MIGSAAGGVAALSSRLNTWQRRRTPPMVMEAGQPAQGHRVPASRVPSVKDNGRVKDPTLDDLT